MEFSALFFSILNTSLIWILHIDIKRLQRHDDCQEDIANAGVLCHKPPVQGTQSNKQGAVLASDLTIRDKQFIFAEKTRMIDVESNFKALQTGTKCKQENETQKYLLSTVELQSGGYRTPSSDDLFGAKP